MSCATHPSPTARATCPQASWLDEQDGSFDPLNDQRPEGLPYMEAKIRFNGQRALDGVGVGNA